MQPLQVRAGSAGGRLPAEPLAVSPGSPPGQRRELSRARPAGSSPPLWLCLPGSPPPPSFLCATGGSLGGGLRLGRGQHLSSLPAGGRGRFHPGLDAPSPGSLPQTEAWQPSVAKLSEMLPKILEASALPPPKGAPPPMSMLSGTTAHVSVTPSVHSGTPSSISWMPARVVSPGELDSAAPEAQAQQMRPQRSSGRSRRALSETLVHFRSFPEVHPWSSAPAALLDEPLPLEQTDWSQSKMLDLGPIDALNFFCEQQRARQQGVLQGGFERPRRPPCLHQWGPNTVVPQPRDRR